MADDDETVLDLWDDVIEVAVAEVWQRFRVAKPGAVVDVDRLASRITAALRVRFVGTDLAPRDEADVIDAPVIYPGGGGYVMAFDMRATDPVMVVSCDGPVRGFYETGQSVTPVVGQGHDYGCAVAIPGGRVSATDQPTSPPNAAGECLVGAADGSASVVFRGAGLTTPAELGTLILQASAPTAAIRAGGDDAFLGVVRLGDAVAPDATWTTFASAVATFINGLVPGSVVVPNPAKIGITSEASAILVSK